MNSFTAPISDVLQRYSVIANKGLTLEQVAQSRLEFGPNISYLYKKRSAWIIFFEQFKTPLIIVLLLISCLSLFVGQLIDGFIILFMLLVNAVVGTYQEFKAEKSLQKLSLLITHRTRVRRDSTVQIIDHEDLVPGDIVLLKTGDVVPADIRLLSAVSLSCNEAVLTGESMPVYKEHLQVDHGEQPQQLRGALFMGTAIVAGFAEGIVVATGRDTFLGQSVDTREVQESLTKFEKNMRRFSDFLFRFVLVFSGVTAIANMHLGRDAITSMMLGVTLALGITPEILPVIVTIAMSRGAFHLSKKNVVMKRLSALEDLGNVDILCSDKTGTLTTGVIKLSDSMNAQNEQDDSVIQLAYLCSAEYPQAGDRTTENPLDSAIKVALSKKVRKQLDSYLLLDVSDFDYASKRMLALLSMNNKRFLIRKGATELLLNHCTKVLNHGQEEPLTRKNRERIAKVIESYEKRGLRVISVAHEEVSSVVSRVGDSHDMTYVGFITLEDPPRTGVLEEIKRLRQQKVVVKIITGDSCAVTLEIANKVGLDPEPTEVIEGEHLEHLSKVDFDSIIREKTYFVRTTPLQKLRIIQGLRELGHTVMYMGDGINDVGALRAADVGISVDSATPVTKDVSDVILLEKNLNALSDAVEQGRKTFANTQKFIFNTMSSSFGNVITAAIASFFLPFIPLLPKQLLLLDSLSDVQHLVFATDNVDKEQLTAPKVWRDRTIISFVLIFGLLSTIFDFLHIFIFISIAKEAALFRTLWFVESIITEMLATFSMRTEKFLFVSKPSTGLTLVTVGTLAVALLLPALPTVNNWLGFTVLTMTQYGIVFFIALSYIVVLEVVKRRYYRK